MTDVTYDPLLSELAEYVTSPLTMSAESAGNALLALTDAVGVAVLAAGQPRCRQLLGSLDGGSTGDGVPIPGTRLRLPMVDAAFDISTLIRWLDFNDTWLAAEWGHPSDNLGALLAVADQVSRRRIRHGGRPFTVGSLLEALAKAYEIQGVLAISTDLHSHGLDHVLLVELASAALATHLLGGTQQQVAAAASNAIADGSTTRVYRHAPRVSWRKSWAAGEAAARAVRYALLALRGDEGCPYALSAPRWGLQDALLGGAALKLEAPLSTYVVERVLFKVPWPAEFHAQTAVEAALRLRQTLLPRLDELVRLEVATQRAAMTILDKRGELATPADRDHCLQYIVAAAIIHGDLNAERYEDPAASDPRLEELRRKIVVSEWAAYTAAYADPELRAVPNSIVGHFADGSSTDRVEVMFPVGHPRRRAEAAPLLRTKLMDCLSQRLPEVQTDAFLRATADPATVRALSVPEFLQLLSLAGADDHLRSPPAGDEPLPRMG